MVRGSLVHVLSSSPITANITRHRDGRIASCDLDFPLIIRANSRLSLGAQDGWIVAPRTLSRLAGDRESSPRSKGDTVQTPDEASPTSGKFLMDEKRKSTRHRVLKAGKIAFGGGIVDCTVRNLSETGAALDVVSSVGIPDHFTLVIAVDGVKRPCRVAWRKAARIGVLFG